ncbi:hypothetical protein CPB83DRAFT_681179 [Crepidotus variabilis]|uniref:UvrD-like helicase ATP-binding domain-containing protein n=1 Tax=Crepidotus variabilis TaxID=179855 RepID=A0A9P6E785_9AGAR|nr:hypothetical protein CPB83DRAFT_681179 [Crepidotus variabilis]
MNIQRKVQYRTGLFNPENLSDIQKIDDALNEFGGAINRENYVSSLKELLDRNHIIELVISSIGEHVPLKQWILDDFPSSAKEFDESFAGQILGRLHMFIRFHVSQPMMMDQHSIEAAPDLFQMMLNMTFVDKDKTSTDKVVVAKKSKAKPSQRELKQARKAVHDAATVDYKLFKTLSLPVPKSRLEAEVTCMGLLVQLKVTLAVILEEMRQPRIIEIVKALFVVHEMPEALPNIKTDVPSVQHEDSALDAPITEDFPAVYPMVQPLKGALYFDTPDGFGKWRIFISSKASAHLRHYRDNNPKVFSTIKNTIMFLSHGNFLPDKHKPLKGSGTIVPIYEAKMGGDLRLIYIVDCITDYDNISEIQALRIFGVYTHAQIDNRLWDSVSLYLSNRNPIYRQRCLHRKSTQGGDKYCFDPVTFSGPGSNDDFEASPNEVPSLPGDDSNELHQIISLEKYVMLSQELLDCIELNRPAAFPFELSRYEQTIVQHPHSCYVLGRSGTGKTTTMLFKMLLIERNYQLSGSSGPRPRQMFVTKSRVLAKRVEEQFLAYFTTLLTASHTETSHQTPTLWAQAVTIGDEQNIFWDDEDESWQSHLPERFSQLTDYHFPLFITFDKLCAMIEADNSLHHSRDNYSFNTDFKSRGTLLSYDRFLSHYWPHLPQDLKMRSHPSLVFSEFMSVIAGSEGAIISPDGYLSREAYRQLSARAQPTFADCRDAIYGLYMAYRKIKHGHGDIDLADRTRNIILEYAGNPSWLQKVSNLYVDETQDNLLIDTLLLRMLCSNPQGLFWAGDTAQTISAGSAFRFNDLKAFLHRIEEKRRKYLPSPVIGQYQEPKIFQLSVNFRSHAGIVNCAHSIIQIIMKYWKNAIDSLKPERGKASGAKPIFYQNIYAGYVHEGHFMKRNITHEPVVELGAHQCILVRDDQAKKQLAEKMGRDIGLVLTLYESKGLEFNDVFLYNFFHDSTVPASDWRLLLNVVPHTGTPHRAPAFNPTRHAAICSELKCLYVAVTRARNNLRIADESDIGSPMQILWDSHGFIVTCKPGEEPKDFAKPSEDKNDWADRAKMFFDNNQWLLAKQCYQRAGRTHAAAVANSYYLQETARQTPIEGSGAKRKSAFTSAAEAFASCADKTHEREMKSRYLKRSGDCYEEGHLYLPAAYAYRQGGFLNQTTICFKKAGSFDNVHSIIIHSSDQLSKETLRSVQDVTRLHYVAKQDFEKVHQLFENPEEEQEFLEDRSLNLVQVDLLLRHDKKSAAAELHLAENRILEAIDLFLEDGTKESISRAKDCIFCGLWKQMPFGVIPADEPEVVGLFDMCNRIPQNSFEQAEQEEISMFRLVYSHAFDELHSLVDSFLRHHNSKAAFLCLDHIFAKPPTLSNQSLSKTEQKLQRFLAYAQILREFHAVDDPVGDHGTSSLFGLQLLDGIDGSVTLLSSSPIAAYLNGERESHLLVQRKDIVTAFRRCLKDRLLARVTQENDAAQLMSSDLQLSPCIRHVVYNDCLQGELCTWPHIVPDVQWHRLFVNVHLLQILIYQSIVGLQHLSEMKSQQKFWILKLYEVLNPASHHFGPTCGISQQSLQSFPAATSVVLDWVRSVSYTLDFDPKDSFLTIAMQCATMVYALEKKDAASFMAKCQFVTARYPANGIYLRGPSRQNSLQEMLFALEINKKSSIATGIQFLRHIIDVEAPVNMLVLCSFIERVCSQLVVCNCLQWKGDFHYVTLPRTWLSNLLLDVDLVEVRHQDYSYFWQFLPPIRTLLRTLFFPTGQSPLRIRPEFRALDRQNSSVRGMYIARLCRVLGLLGSNIRIVAFQNEILEIFRSIKRDLDHGISPLYGRYIYAEDFYRVSVATRRSMVNSPFDNMVQLLHADRVQHPITDIFGLFRIVYSKTEELPEKLRSDWNSKALANTIDNDQSPVEGPSEPLDEAKLTEVDMEDIQAGSKPEDENFIPDTEIDPSLYLGHSQHEVKAACVLQRMYRSFRDRKRSMEGVDYEDRLRQWHSHSKDLINSHTQVFSMETRIFHLGPVAHLLAILDAVYPAISRAKKYLGKRLVDGNSNHEQLEEISAKQTVVVAPITVMHRKH